MCVTHIIHMRKTRSSSTICVRVHIFGPNATIMVQHPKKTLDKKSLGWGGEGDEFNLKVKSFFHQKLPKKTNKKKTRDAQERLCRYHEDGYVCSPHYSHEKDQTLSCSLWLHKTS